MNEVNDVNALVMLPCPFCGGPTGWCDEHDEEHHHCHLIVCLGECKASFDMANDGDSPDSHEELKQVCVTNFNRRPI